MDVLIEKIDSQNAIKVSISHTHSEDKRGHCGKYQVSIFKILQKRIFILPILYTQVIPVEVENVLHSMKVLYRIRLLELMMRCSVLR